MVATRRSRSQRRAGLSSGADAARAAASPRFISFAAVRWAIVAAIAAVALRRKVPAPGICPVDPAACHFSQHLDGARSLLRMRAAALKDVCNVSVSRLPEVAPGLATDAVVVDNCAGANCSTLVHLSGVHGVEGYAGSAIQSALLLQFGWGEACPPRGTKAVLIHAVNPFGMAYGRRWNEAGVDLNRNALLRSETFEGLTDRRRDTEDAYAELSNLLNPTSWSEITFWWRSLSTVARKGFVATKRVLVSGQYSVPGALWYGGTELQKSHKHVLKFLGKAVPCVEINQCIGCTSSLSHFSAMTWPRWLRRAVRNRHRHPIEQASRRWRGGRRGDSGRTRRKFDFHTATYVVELHFQWIRPRLSSHKRCGHRLDVLVVM